MLPVESVPMSRSRPDRQGKYGQIVPGLADEKRGRTHVQLSVGQCAAVQRAAPLNPWARAGVSSWIGADTMRWDVAQCIL